MIIEGTYPYVAGGVSTWIHQLISSMKNIKFAIIHVASHSDPTRTIKYKIPSNVIYLKEIYLHDYQLNVIRNRSPRKKDFETLVQTYQELIKGNYRKLATVVPLFSGRNTCFDTATFFDSKHIFYALNQFYEHYAKTISYLDFFWTWRGIHLPILQVIQSEFPQASIYHAISTGYAGLAGALAKIQWGGHYMLTEHGIYTYERMLEIAQATWIYEPESEYFRPVSDLTFFKKWWVHLFNALSRMAYEFSDQIYTIYEGNKIKQVLDGADGRKISIIPNGIDLSAYEGIQRERRKTPQIGLVGRVVNIKDIKTFIHACKIILEEIPEAKCYIIGPTEEEPEYTEECKMLVEMFHLEDKIIFTGRVNVQDYYKFLDVVVLTSLSEAQPYTVHEANLCGIPVVATDVGACRELLEGTHAEDRALGISGLVTDVGSPQATATSVIKLLRDPEFYERCSRAGIDRVRKYYDKDDMISKYLNIYEKII
jgi:glycosyltransferase involved in cell wall biosynthesis